MLVRNNDMFCLHFVPLEELNLSNSSKEKERFLAEVYRLQQEDKHVDDEETDKEIQSRCLT